MSTPGPQRLDIDAAVRAVGLQVDRETVLRARAILLSEAERLDLEVRRARANWSGLEACGGDPVSPEAVTAFNERIDALLTSCSTYTTDLRNAATGLDATARHYGYTDEEIAASFRRS